VVSAPDVVARVAACGDRVRLTFAGEGLRLNGDMTPAESTAFRELLRQAEDDARAARPGGLVKPRTEIEQLFGDRLYTAEEVAEIWKVDTGTVVRWARAGSIPALRLPGGAGYRFSENAIREHMQSMRLHRGGGSSGDQDQ
jgi:excisionase family DNA binding protein